MKKNKILKLSFLSILSACSFVPVVSCGSNSDNKKPEEFLYQINNQKFTTKEDAVNYMMNNVAVYKNVPLYRNTFTKDGIEISDNYRFIANELKEYWKKVSAHTNVPFDELKSMLDSEKKLSGSAFNFVDLTKNDQNIEVFLGKNGIAFEDEEKAKLSYFNINKIFELHNEKGNYVYESKEQIINQIIKEYNHIKSDGKSQDYWRDNSEIISNGLSKVVTVNGKPFPYDQKDKNKLIPFLKTALNRYYLVNGKYYTKDELKANSDLILSDLTDFNILN
ncbi:Uncharacterised protein [Mycoplasmopsis californica]|uniref:Lipoprotein n=1 Tax=Mycoplasmopsis equigenitalium TaxID=114883 RepID=A0ABY5J155_9BACT|nr:hypothetical protein [Mycoplasmopsis equigenitalium]UUD36987.1 hypothetical protein NPA09_00190 [Mycoplasmopsis equigenitalium]VEU69715.1 Uncharacterised protein [Mycoplasmopsis californica]